MALRTWHVQATVRAHRLETGGALNQANMNPPLSKSTLDVSSRVFVITGGTQGLGLGVARCLKQHGASGLVLVSRSKCKASSACDELNSDTCRCVHVCADLKNADDAASVISRAAEAMKDIGAVTGVVNAAATTARGNLISETSDGFDEQFAVNTRAPFLITQGFAKEMEKNRTAAIAAGGSLRQGSVVNICSVAACGGAPFVMAYSASKAALVNMTKNNAAELAPRGIRVNGINMGQCLTDNEDQLQREQSGSNDDSWVQRADAQVPLGRILRPADVAPTVLFLLSDASAMMTGAIIDLHPDFAHGMCSLLSEDVRGQD